jgi:hypothetical protein
VVLVNGLTSKKRWISRKKPCAAAGSVQRRDMRAVQLADFARFHGYAFSVQLSGGEFAIIAA